MFTIHFGGNTPIFGNTHDDSLFGMMVILVGGWTNPSEKYARQNGFIFPK